VNLLSHLPSFTSTVNSLGVFPSILIPNDPHVPIICFTTDFKEVAYDDSYLTLATLTIESTVTSPTHSDPDVPEPI